MNAYIYEAPVSIYFNPGELDQYKSSSYITDEPGRQVLHEDIKVGLNERSDKKALDLIKEKIHRDYPGRKFTIWDGNGFWHGRSSR